MDRYSNNVGIVLDGHGEERVEPEGKSLNLVSLLYVQTLTYCHEFWVVTERINSWIQVTEMSFLQRVSGFSQKPKTAFLLILLHVQDI